MDQPQSRPVERKRAFGENYTRSAADRVGIWLSGYRIRRWVPTFAGKAVGDFGCGYDAGFVRAIAGDARTLTVIDVSLADEIKRDPKIKAIEGALPEALFQVPSESLDVVICNNVLEHLWDPQTAVQEFHRILVPGGTCFLNVPSWRGKVFLETLAFRLHMTAEDEIEDHKAYYTPEDLWKLVISGGFKPSRVSCGSHKLGLNSYAVASKS
jgi:SAM-dependent methyltransferase